MATKRFEGKKGRDGLIMISASGAEPRQATSYTVDGPLLRFSLAGDEGATYSVREGEDEFADLKELFSDAAGRDPEPKKDEKKGIEPAKTA